jgi:hypothetical protein
LISFLNNFIHFSYHLDEKIIDNISIKKDYVNITENFNYYSTLIKNKYIENNNKKILNKLLLE